ncbi:metal ABC transporter permease [Brucepastera parasyntrophica]|uniref:metal ABC transporter permease n=1 Tax=Brucepastera parasyntrophica TaxID=2880008 RepID=UPI00210927C7|nr:metal ABC transporter permease [Brucepastera parasyntrophica]ULQ60848.1 metal ABC transporter permease [Brucepastera parasyntrophica]
MNFLTNILFNPDIIFIRNALIAGLLSSVLFGTLGSIVTVKRIAGLAGAISHAVLGGIGMALFLSATGIIPGMSPMAGAIIFAVLSALIIGLVSLRAKQREDTVINAIWAIGMSIGVLFMAKTPGYTDPSSYLFGNMLLISNQDLILLAGLDVAVLLLAWKFYPQIEASSFDEEFARLRGVKTNMFFLILLAIIAIAIVLLQTFVGILMVIAMLTLPSGTAGYFVKNIAGMMVFASIFSALFSCAGLAAGWVLDVPVGAMTVVIAGAVFLCVTILSLAKKKMRGKIKQGQA